LSGAAWAHLARPDLAADCYLASGPDALLAVVPLVAAGRLEEAEEVLTAAPGAPEPMGELAGAVAAWARGDADGALTRLERSARMAEILGGVEVWPDSPHAVGVLAAAQWLDTARADRLAARALERNVGGAAFDTRHQLVAAWAAVRAGRVDDARAALETTPVVAVRDAAVAAAVQAAIALRTAEPADLPAIQRKLVRAVDDGMADPFTAGLATELALLTARVGGDPAPILRPHVELEQRLRGPATVVVPLAWARLLLAVAADDAGAARRAAAALAPAAGALDADTVAGEPARLLADAAGVFADVLGGTVDVDRVRSVVARLVERGLVTEAARLAGAAGLRCADAAAARVLLGDHRRLRATQVRAEHGQARPVGQLTERERDVARAVLEGRTHREIGAQLFISAKTVEHHVARVRQKLGAGNRAELLAAIRGALGGDSGELGADPLQRADHGPGRLDHGA
jgi:DNA-binding CsgD family transcriptional regulator